MNTAVVIPPIEDFYSTPHRLSGLGARVVQRIVCRAGHSCNFFNFPLWRKKTIPLPSHLHYLEPYIDLKEWGPTSFFTTYKRFGGDYSSCAETIISGDPDLICISCFAFCYADAAIAFAAACKAFSPRTPIALGGAGPSVFPHYFLQSGNIDFIFTGEAEQSFPQFLIQFEKANPDYSGIPNLFIAGDPLLSSGPTKRSTPYEIHFTGSLSDYKRQRLFSTSLTRGCPRSCSFCSIRLCHGTRVRTVLLSTIEKEIEKLPCDKPVLVNFEDDNPLLDVNYFFSALDCFRAYFQDVRFTAENGLDYSLLSPELVKKMKKAGFEKLNLTLGSVDPAVLAPENRSVNRRHFETVLEAAAGCGFEIITYVIAGLSHDSAEAAVRSLAYLYRLPTKVGLSMFYPVPGIQGFEKRNIFLSKPSSLAAGSSAYPWSKTLSTQELITLFRIARTANFLKSSSQKNSTASETSKYRDLKLENLKNTVLGTGELYSYRKRGKEKQLYRITSTDKKMVDQFFSNLP